MKRFEVLMVRNEHTFMVNAIVANLGKLGCSVVETEYNVKDISNYEESADIIIFYTDNNMADNTNALVYIKDLCIEKNKQVVAIGNRDELDEIYPVIPSMLLADAIERPVDMNTFSDKILQMMSNDVIEQRKKSILIVDDDSSFIQLLREWLKDDYRVGMAKSGLQAITWLARNSVDLILLDYEMPVINGLQVFEMLKSEAISKNIPVMFLTGKSDKESIMKVMELKPAGYMLKNITKQQLLTHLENFFVKQTYNNL